MADKRKYILTSAIFLFCCLFGYSQNDAYYIKETEEGFHFVQIFTWQASDLVLKYDFLIEEQQSDGTYLYRDKVETEISSVEVSLPAGAFRYRITAYNLLGLPEVTTEWKTVTINKAYEPKVTAVSPRNIFLEEEQDGIYTITGEQLQVDSLFYLIPKEGKSEQKILGTIIESDERNRRVRVSFDVEKVDVGNYALNAVNPGGLNSSISPIVVKFKKPFDLDISGGYAPFYVLYDDTIETYFGSSFQPIGFSGRGTFIPVKRRLGYFGFSLAGSYFFMNKDTEALSVSSHALAGHLDFVYQKLLYKRMLLLEIHGGGGIFAFSDMKFQFEHGVESDPLFSLNPMVTGGIAFQLYVQKRLYIELGCDYTHVFISDMSLGYIQPTLSCGWQF